MGKGGYNMKLADIMAKVPKCDFCGKSAYVEGRTHAGIWVYMCTKHYMSYGVGLGPGKGQRLILSELCIFCGEQIPEGIQFCPGCGNE